MQFVPWRNIADWQCNACGNCCKLYSVVISFHEWLRLTKTFGVETTVAGLDRFFIKRVDDGSCAFLCSDFNNYYCGLQSMKPEACKIWPFKVFAEPRFGQSNQAAYNFGDKHLYVYADTTCSGLRYGTPTWDFQHVKVREFAELSLGIRGAQHKTTRSTPLKTNQKWGRDLFP